MLDPRIFALPTIHESDDLVTHPHMYPRTPYPYNAVEDSDQSSEPQSSSANLLRDFPRSPSDPEYLALSEEDIEPSDRYNSKDGWVLTGKSDGDEFFKIQSLSSEEFCDPRCLQMNLLSPQNEPAPLHPEEDIDIVDCDVQSSTKSHRTSKQSSIPSSSRPSTGSKRVRDVIDEGIAKALKILRTSS